MTQLYPPAAPSSASSAFVGLFPIVQFPLEVEAPISGHEHR